jgi:Cohesin domain
MKLKSKLWIWFLIPCLGLVLMGLSACGSDSDDDNSGTGAFVPDVDDPVSNSVYLELVDTDDNNITLAVKAKDLSNVYGIWFNLDFDGTIFNYASAEQGTFLGDPGSTFFFATGKTSSVVVGVTKQAEASGTSGSGTICTLSFVGIAEGNSRFDFSLNSAADPNGNLIGGISWFGGLATVVM